MPNRHTRYAVLALPLGFPEELASAITPADMQSKYPISSTRSVRQIAKTKASYEIDEGFARV
jgi:hypothetical protein